MILSPLLSFPSHFCPKEYVYRIIPEDARRFGGGGGSSRGYGEGKGEKELRPREGPLGRRENNSKVPLYSRHKADRNDNKCQSSRATEKHF